MENVCTGHDPLHILILFNRVSRFCRGRRALGRCSPPQNIKSSMLSQRSRRLDPRLFTIQDTDASKQNGTECCIELEHRRLSTIECDAPQGRKIRHEGCVFFSTQRSHLVQFDGDRNPVLQCPYNLVEIQPPVVINSKTDIQQTTIPTKSIKSPHVYSFVMGWILTCSNTEFTTRASRKLSRTVSESSGDAVHGYISRGNRRGVMVRGEKKADMMAL